jgi:hypothetical protein
MMISGRCGAALLFDGRIQIYEIETSNRRKDDIILPKNVDFNVQCAATSPNFLAFGTDTGHLLYYETDEWLPVHEYKHSVCHTLSRYDCV